MWICIQLKKDFGCHLLRNKTISDRLISFVSPLGYKFKEDKPFSNFFLVLSNVEEKLNAFFTETLRHELFSTEIKPLYLEVKNNQVVFGTKQPIEVSVFTKLLALAIRIAPAT